MPLASTPTDLGSLSLEKPLSSGFFFGRDIQRGHARLDRASMSGERCGQHLVCRLRAGEAFGADDAQLAQAQPLGTGQYRCGGFVFGLGM